MGREGRRGDGGREGEKSGGRSKQDNPLEERGERQRENERERERERERGRGGEERGRDCVFEEGEGARERE